MKKISAPYLLLAFFAPCLTSAEEEKEKVTYVDHVLPILENKCVNCHNADEAKGGLDLSTYAATLSGGSGGDVVASEDPGSSRLFTLSAHTEEPVMPPRGTKATDKELQILSDWIAGGLLETSSSRARKSDKPKIDFNSITSTGKPEGPPAMPEHLILQPEVVTERPNAVPAIAHSPWAPIVAVAGQKQVLLYHSEYHDLLGVLPYPEGFPQTLSFSPNGAYLSCGGGRAGKSGNVVAWDIKTGERIIEVGKEYDIVLGADVSPDLKNAIMGGPKRNIKLWDTVAGEEISSIKKHPDWLLTAAYSPDGVIFATGGRNGGLYVWEAATGYEFYTLKGHTGAVTDLSWRADGNLLASASEDGQIILWEMLEGKQVKKWNAHNGGALAVTFSPDGKLASVGRDKTVKIWQADGKELRSIKASDDIVLSVAFSQDSKRVFTGDWHGAIKVWDAESGADLATIKPNPPTIEEQLAYSEKRIRELTGELPKLEQGIKAVSVELADARKALSSADQKIAETTKLRDGKKKEVASLESKIKTLTPQVEQITKAWNDLKGKTKAVQDALAKESQSLKSEQGKVAKAEATLKVHAETVQKATAALNVAKTEVAKFALDPAEQKQHDQLTLARTKAAEAKQKAEAALAQNMSEKEKTNGLLNQANATLAKLDGQMEPLQKAISNAESLKNSASVEREKADEALVAASKGGQIPPMDLVDAQATATENERHALSEWEKAKSALSAAEKSRKETMQSSDQLTAKLAAITTAIQQQTQIVKRNGEVFAKAEAALAPVRTALAPLLDRRNKALAVVTTRSRELETAEKQRNTAKAAMEAAQKALGAVVAKVEPLKQDVANAQAAEKATANTAQAKKKELDASKAQLTSAQGALKKAEETLVAVTKQRESAKAKIDSIAKKEAETKKSMELAKAELKDSQFLAKKWEAAAINLTAKEESDELDDMEVDLEDMKEDEIEAKTEMTEAKKSRAAAEQTLAVAKKTVNEGEQQLREKSSTVLERALQLVANRAIAELKVDAGLEQGDTPAIELAAIFNEEDPEELVQVGDMPEEIEEEQVIETVAAEALAYKSRDEITEEVETLRKRLSEIEGFLASTYTAADKTKATVDAASKVAKETPKVIEERTKLEADAAKELAEAEEERKRQEAALAEQKKHIEDLRKKYLATLPERE